MCLRYSIVKYFIHYGY